MQLEHKLNCCRVNSYMVAPFPAVVDYPPMGVPAEDIAIQSHSGSQLAAWHGRVNASKGVLVLVHGMRGNRYSMSTRAELLMRAGYSVVMVDLRAHGESSGDQITLGSLEKFDVLAAVEYARQQHPNEKIGVLGMSLGGASTILASPDIDALVLESVYPTIEVAVYNRVAYRFGSFAWLPTKLLLAQLEPRLGISVDDLRATDKIADIGCPVFIMTGENDWFASPKETTMLYEAAAEPKQLWLVPDTAHNDIMRASEVEYSEKILDFLAQHMA